MSPTRAPKKPLSFGEAFHQLERLTEELENESLDLDRALEKFERGLELKQQLEGRLRSVEERVERIRQKFGAVPEADDRAADEAAEA